MNNGSELVPNDCQLDTKNVNKRYFIAAIIQIYITENMVQG
jgi:hypothetical protein